MLAFEAVGTPERALPLLEQSERDFPHDYNPPERRAEVLLKLNRPKEALAAARQARALVYGPRTLRVLFTQAEAQRRLGEKIEAKHSLQEAERLIARLPASQRQPSQWKQLDEARRRLGP
jgi:tetratricopeptide (TPR) repeat protein